MRVEIRVSSTAQNLAWGALSRDSAAMALAFATSALSLVLPMPVAPPALVQPATARIALHTAYDDGLVFPATQALAGTIESTGGGLLDGPKRDIIKGELDLGSLLDTVPTDAGGKKGQQRDEQGLQRLKERQAQESEAARVKYEAVVSAERSGRDISFAGETKEASNAGIAAANALFGR